MENVGRRVTFNELSAPCPPVVMINLFKPVCPSHCVSLVYYNSLLWFYEQIYSLLLQSNNDCAIHLLTLWTLGELTVLIFIDMFNNYSLFVFPLNCSLPQNTLLKFIQLLVISSWYINKNHQIKSLNSPHLESLWLMVVIVITVYVSSAIFRSGPS